MTARRGTFLVVCLSMMALMVILCFSVLHVLRYEVDTATGNQRYLLAEAAARAGLNHAQERILWDYNQATMQTMARSGNHFVPVTMPAMTVLDGQWRAPFQALWYPNAAWGWLVNTSADAEKDVTTENPITDCMAWWGGESGESWGYSYMDGRGRYYEPGYYNLTPSVPGTTYLPNVSLNFLNLHAPVPERAQAMFYDEQFRRIQPSGNPALDRQQARFRLRYAVMVDDLSGHLLINPNPNPNLLVGLPNNAPVDYRFPEQNNPWMPVAQNELINICINGFGLPFAAQLSSVFEGRGYSTNADFDHTTLGVRGDPKTFPLMYRNHPQLIQSGNNAGTYQGTGCWSSWIDGVFGGNPTNLFFYDQHPGASTVVNHAPVPVGLAQGGEALPAGCGMWGQGTGANFGIYYDGGYPYIGQFMHCLMGPQLSFEDVAFAAHGEAPAWTGGSSGWDRYALTPFGHRETTTGFQPGSPQNRWYQGRVDTPFLLNLMTTPLTTINKMLNAYLPPQIKSGNFGSVSWYKCTGFDPLTGWEYNPVLMRTDPIQPQNPLNQTPPGSGFDMFVNSTVPHPPNQPLCFEPWDPPVRQDSNPDVQAQNPPGATGINQVISPDYFAKDERQLLSKYPGPMMLGVDGTVTSPPMKQGGDDLGKNMDETAQLGAPVTANGVQNEFYAVGLDVLTNQYALTFSAGAPEESASMGVQSVYAWSGSQVGSPPAGWGTTDPYPGYDYAVKNPVGQQMVHQYSYFFDLLTAMATALNVVHDEYLQYNVTCSPGSANQLFHTGGADPNPMAYQSIADVDRLFLAEMGESISAPGTAAPANLHLTAFKLAHGQWNVPYWAPYTPMNNIYSLVQQDLLRPTNNSLTSAQRAHVMELLLNDMRMSFFGASPQYSDAVAGSNQPEFRPLDFLGQYGNGKVYCSCYSTANGFPPDVDGLPCAPIGTKPPNYFTICGTFFMGKSHYYRILSRGEVWDNVLNRATDEATFDSVLCVDPEGTDPTQTQVLYQRMVTNNYQALHSAVRR